MHDYSVLERCKSQYHVYNFSVSDVFEYDVIKAFPSFLYRKKYIDDETYNKLLNDKSSYHIVGKLIKKYNLYTTIVNEIKKMFIDLLKDSNTRYNIYKYYVDEIITNLDIDINNDKLFDKYGFKLRKQKILLFASGDRRFINGFIKIYNDGSIKISKSCLLPYANQFVYDLYINGKAAITKYISKHYAMNNYIVVNNQLVLNNGYISTNNLKTEYIDLDINKYDLNLEVYLTIAYKFYQNLILLKI